LPGKCGSITASGGRCRGVAVGSSGLCPAHHPDYQDKRRRGQIRGGKSKADKTLRGLHELLEDLTGRVIDGELETARGAVANQLITTRIKLFEYERRLRETEELAARIEALEAGQKGIKRWRA
jgi:hypothetical protein